MNFSKANFLEKFDQKKLFKKASSKNRSYLNRAKPPGRKGDFSIMNFIAAVLLFVALVIIGALILAQSQKGTAEISTTARVSTEAKDAMNSLAGVHIPQFVEEDEEAVAVLRYGCIYGVGYGRTYMLSQTVPIIVQPRETLEKYFREKFGENFNVTVRCKDRVFSFGNMPPEEIENIQSASFSIPNPYGGRTEAVLLRW